MPSKLTPSGDEFRKKVENNLIHEIFEYQVLRTPKAPAIYFPSPSDCSTTEFWSYEELNQKSNSLAYEILQSNHKNQSIYPGQSLIAILLSKREDFLVATLGILKSVSAFVPLSLDSPLKHLQRILKATGNPLIITTKKILQKMDLDYCSAIYFDEHIFQDDNRTQNLKLPLPPSNLAYIIYTSGSTGIPKGVMVEHKSVVNFSLWEISYYSLTSTDKISLYNNVAFDASIFETFPCLFIGGTLHVVPRSTRLDPKSLLNWLFFSGITITFFPPIIGHEVINEFRKQHLKEMKPKIALRYLTMGGDKIVEAYTDSFPFEIINGYGPTEATVLTTVFPISEYSATEMTSTPIGKPITNAEVYILNKDSMEAVAEFQVGEIWIGGLCLARGYYNDQTLTQKKFIQNPFNNNPESRIYQTGDLGRWLPCGNLEFIGRVDNQVKIRGFRVQLDGIEYCLKELPQVRNAVVFYEEMERDTLFEKELVAFVVPQDSKIDNSKNGSQDFINCLKEHCINNLPQYMVPKLWAILKNVELTPTGKPDRKALLALANFQRIESKCESYHSDIKSDFEKKIAKIWATVLHISISSFGFSDNFFNLGGHSLLVFKIVNRIRSTLKIEELETSSLFKYPNFGDFVGHLQRLCNNELKSHLDVENLNPLKRKPEKNLPLSFAQQLIWLHIEKTSAIGMYNNFTWINMSCINESSLEFSVNALFQKHEALRTTMIFENGTPFQTFAEFVWQPLQVVDFLEKSKSLEKRKNHAKEWMAVEARKVFDLLNGPLAKFILIRLDENVNQLCIITHHLVMDGVSLAQIILPDLCAFYENKLQQSNNTKSACIPNISYGDYVLRCQEKFENLSPKALATISFWKTKLSDLIPLTLSLSQFPIVTTLDVQLLRQLRGSVEKGD